jgi:uncharacterized membrane protein YjgN (DUF898 family)
MPPSGTAPLVVGILSLVCCGLLGPVAWIMGSSYEAKCRSMNMQPDGAGTAGKIIGMIVTALMVLGVMAYIGIFILAMAGGATSSSFR